MFHVAGAATSDVLRLACSCHIPRDRKEGAAEEEVRPVESPLKGYRQRSDMIRLQLSKDGSGCCSETNCGD